MEKTYKDIRYVKLHFSLQIVGNAILPVQKASMLRGGMGEMLLQSCCIADRQCETCDFEKECIVRRIMYSKMEIQPEFMSKGDSVGYVIECDNYKTGFADGDILEFRMILIGKTIVYFSQILDAFYRLGLSGLGKDKAKYRIIKILNSKKEPIMDGNNIYMDRLKVGTLNEYIEYRLKKMSETLRSDNDEKINIRFTSPLSLKYKGEMLDCFNAEAVMKAIERRLYILCCYEGIEMDKNLIDGEIPEIDIISCRRVDVPRFSFRKSEKMILWGLEGEVKIYNASQEMIELLIAGELVHIGKNTSFGFGKYKL